VGVLFASAAVVLAGNVNSPGGPTSDLAQMYTLEQIYDRLNDGTAATKQTTFQEPASGPGSTMHTLDQIYDLVGKRAFVPKTGQTAFYATGDDGDLQKGVSWPSPRFTDNSDGTVTDNLTGLIWLKKANCGTADWATALSYSNALYDGCTSCFGGSTDCGLSDGSSAGDWRLPNVRELQSLSHYGLYNPAVPNTAGTGKWTSGDPFTGVQSVLYWSSTTYAGSTDYAWSVSLTDGVVWNADAKTISHRVWPVRGGQ
jgi:hypothetical protein